MLHCCLHSELADSRQLRTGSRRLSAEYRCCPADYFIDCCLNHQHASPGEYSADLESPARWCCMGGLGNILGLVRGSTRWPKARQRSDQYSAVFTESSRRPRDEHSAVSLLLDASTASTLHPAAHSLLLYSHGLPHFDCVAVTAGCGRFNLLLCIKSWLAGMHEPTEEGTTSPHVDILCLQVQHRWCMPSSGS